MTTLEELQEEVVAALHILTRDNLLGICYFLNISGEQRTDVRGKSCISLVTHIMKYLEREEVAELEDDGMSELLLLKDKVADMISGIDNETAQTEQDIVTAGTQRGMEELRTVNEHQELGIKQTTKSNAIVNDSLHQPKTTAGPQVSMQLSPTPMQPQCAPHLYTNRPAHAPRRCFVCQQTGSDERCTHCYRCGSGEQFQAGCKIRGVRPSREAPLNGKWLSPRDEC